MAKEDLIEVLGKVTANLSNGLYDVTLDNGHGIQARMCGKMTKSHIRIMMGDTVSVEVSPYDLSKGRIVYRHHVVNGQVLAAGEEPANFNSRKRMRGEKHWRGRK